MPASAADERREHVERMTSRPLHRDDRADHAERGEPDDTDPRAAIRQRTEHQAEEPDHDQHADPQRDLVVRPELLDREVPSATAACDR